MNMSERHQKAKSILISPSEVLSKGEARSRLSKRSVPEEQSPFPPLEAKRSHMSDTKTPRKCEAFSKALG